MADDKPTLTRRRVLGGMATIGVAGALGAGTWAEYTDEETAMNVVAEAGTLDLKVNGGDQPVSVSIGPLAPGDSGEKRVTLTNVGNTDAEKLTADLDETNSDEGSESEAEPDSTGSGDFDEHLELGLYLGNNSGDASNRFYGWTPFNQLEQNPHSITTNDGSIIGDGEELVLEYRFPEGPSDNDAMGDTVDFDILLTLEQNA